METMPIRSPINNRVEFIAFLRVLIAEQHLVNYTVDKERKMVIVYAIVDGRRDYLNLI